MAALSPSAYSDNLRAVGGVVVALQQSFVDLQQCVSQLMATVQEVRGAFGSASSCVSKSDAMLQGLQDVFRRSGLDAGHQRWSVDSGSQHQQRIEMMNTTLTNHHLVLEKQLLLCSDQIEKLVSLVGRHFLVANFSPAAAASDSQRRQQLRTFASPLEHQVEVSDILEVSSESVFSNLLQQDYTEDVALLKSSILDSAEDGMRVDTADTVSHESSGHVLASLHHAATDDREEPSVHDAIVAEQSTGHVSQPIAVPTTPKKVLDGDQRRSTLPVAAVAPTTGSALPIADDHGGPTGQSAGLLTLPPADNTSLDAPEIFDDSPCSTPVSNHTNIDAAARDELASETCGYAVIAVNVCPPSQLESGAELNVSNSVRMEAAPSQQGLAAAVCQESAEVTDTVDDDANAGLMFFDVTRGNGQGVRKKPRLSSDGMTKPARAQPKPAAVSSKPSPPRTRTVQKKPSTGNLGKEVKRQNPDEKDEGKSPPMRSRREAVAKLGGASPKQAGSPSSRSLTKRPLSSSRSSLSTASSSSSISDSTSIASPPPGRAETRSLSTAAEGEVRHVVAVKEGAAPLGLRICGGRGHGVFIDSLAEGSVAAACGLKVGDQLLEFADRDFSAITHHAAGHAMLGLKGDINITVQYNPTGYDSLPKGRDTQDSFYIRAHTSRPSEAKKSIQDISTSPGDIFLVTETAPRSHDDSWRAHPVAMATGVAKDKSGFILSRRRALEFLRNVSVVYEPVTLLKREEPRPVVMLGPPQAVFTLRTQLLKEFDKIFSACPVYDVIGQSSMADREDVLLLTNIHDSSRQTYVYKTSVDQAAEKGLHCLLDVSPGDVPTMIAKGQHPIVVLLLKNKSVVIAKEEYGLSWLHTGNVTLQNVARRDCQAVLRIVQEQQKNVIWAPHDVPLTSTNS